MLQTEVKTKMADMNVKYDLVNLIKFKCHAAPVCVQEKEFHTDLQIYLSGHSLASLCGALSCQTLTLGADFSIRTAN